MSRAARPAPASARPRRAGASSLVRDLGRLSRLPPVACVMGCRGSEDAAHEQSVLTGYKDAAHEHGTRARRAKCVMMGGVVKWGVGIGLFRGRVHDRLCMIACARTRGRSGLQEGGDGTCKQKRHHSINARRSVVRQAGRRGGSAKAQAVTHYERGWA
eukprot:6012643-Prymnesium_polylepis.1